MKDGKPSPSAPTVADHATSSSSPPNALWRFLLTPVGKFLGAAVLAIAGAAGLAVWNYASEEVTRPPTLLLNVQSDPAMWNEPQANFGDLAYVVPREPNAIGKPPPGFSWDWQNWAHGIGGVNTWTSLQVTIEAPNEGRVTIQGVRPEVVRRRPPLRGSAISIPGGGATPEQRVIRIDLDRNWPRVEYSDPKSGSPDQPFTLTLADGEVAVFYVDATSQRYDIEWRLKLNSVVNGETYVRTIDDSGKPFRTTSDRNAPRYVWSGGKWVPAGR
jgi:hypothetical protein